MFRAIKRLFVFLGLAAEKATETDAINQAMVERGIRDARSRADKAHYANGQLASQVALLRDQVKRQERQRQELQGLLQVAAASNEQATGVAQINRSLAQVDQVTQRNASASEELAATAEEMAAQADGLQGLVEFFRTGHEQLPVKPAPVSVTIKQPAIHVPGNGRGHYADFGSF